MFNPYWQACALCACCHELGSYSSPPLSWCAIDGFVLDVFGSGVVRKLGLVTGIAAMWALSIASRLGCGRLTATSVCTSITVVKVGLSAWMYPVADTLVAVSSWDLASDSRVMVRVVEAHSTCQWVWREFYEFYGPTGPEASQSQAFTLLVGPSWLSLPS